MIRYRREITHSDQAFARLADAAKKLREEIQSMVKHRRRSDERDIVVDRVLLSRRKRR